MNGKWTFERIGKLASARRRRDLDGQAKEILPPDLYAKYRADRVGITQSESSDSVPPVEEVVRYYLNQNDMANALTVLEQTYGFGPYRRPLAVPKLHSFVVEVDEKMNRLDDRKVEAATQILESDDLQIEQKIELAILVSQAGGSDYVSRKLHGISNSIAGFSLHCESAIRDLLDELASQR